MNDFESDLRSLRRTRPSPALDARMEAAFAAAERAADRRPRVAPWLWWCGGTAGLAAAAAVAVVLTRPVAAPPLDRNVAVYRIEAPAPMRALLLEPAQTRRTPPRVVVHVSNP